MQAAKKARTDSVAPALEEACVEEIKVTEDEPLVTIFVVNESAAATWMFVPRRVCIEHQLDELLEAKDHDKILEFVEMLHGIVPRNMKGGRCWIQLDPAFSRRSVSSYYLADFI